MNYILKRFLIGLGLLIIYWSALFNYETIVNHVLQILGAFYVGLLIYDVTKWLIPAPQIKQEQ